MADVIEFPNSVEMVPTGRQIVTVKMGNLKGEDGVTPLLEVFAELEQERYFALYSMAMMLTNEDPMAAVCAHVLEQVGLLEAVVRIGGRRATKKRGK